MNYDGLIQFLNDARKVTALATEKEKLSAVEAVLNLACMMTTYIQIERLRDERDQPASYDDAFAYVRLIKGAIIELINERDLSLDDAVDIFAQNIIAYALHHGYGTET